MADGSTADGRMSDGSTADGRTPHGSTADGRTLHGSTADKRMRDGMTLASRYRLLELAGAGGMATVWRAYDKTLQRTVAIKLMSDALACDPTALARFAREARMHAGFSHPNLVRIYDYGVTAVQPYLVLEYITGQTLSAKLEHDRLNVGELHRLADDLLQAIGCVHDHGVLHRDIKPTNVLLDTEGHARLTDFGIAQLDGMTRLTLPGNVVGTLHFLAPELLNGQPYSRQSDLFALGVLLRTAAAAGTHDIALQKLIDWLTAQSPQLRPRDAHAALAALREDARAARRRRSLPLPTRSRRLATGPDTVLLPTHKPSVHVRLRSAAKRKLAAALAVVAAAAAVGATWAITATPPRASTSRRQLPPASTTAHRSSMTSARSARDQLNVRLDQLARSVRRAAAAPRGH